MNNVFNFITIVSAKKKKKIAMCTYRIYSANKLHIFSQLSNSTRYQYYLFKYLFNENIQIFQNTYRKEGKPNHTLYFHPLKCNIKYVV